MEDISTYDFINNKFSIDDYIECFVITMGILVIVYMFVISRSEPTMVLVITFALVFAFLVIVQKKYKTKYNDKLKDVKDKVEIIKKKLNISIDSEEISDIILTEEDHTYSNDEEFNYNSSDNIIQEEFNYNYSDNIIQEEFNK